MFQHRQLGSYSARQSQLKICLNTNSLGVILLVEVKICFNTNSLVVILLITVKICLNTTSLVVILLVRRSEHMFQHQQLGSSSASRSWKYFFFNTNSLVLSLLVAVKICFNTNSLVVILLITVKKFAVAQPSCPNLDHRADPPHRL
jgi:hypothetical protein